MSRYAAPKLIPFGLLSLLGAFTVAPKAEAHITLVEPIARYADATLIKGCPCGKATGGGNSNRTCKVDLDGSDPNRDEARAQTFEAGSTITLRFNETVGHEGRFRVAFDPDGADFDDFNLPENVLLDVNDPSGNTGNTTGSTWEFEVTLPDMPCDNCTLQLIQVMDANVADQPVDGTQLANLSTYYTCVDLTLTASSTPVDTTDTESAAANSSSDTATTGTVNTNTTTGVGTSDTTSTTTGGTDPANTNTATDTAGVGATTDTASTETATTTAATPTGTTPAAGTATAPATDVAPTPIDTPIDPTGTPGAAIPAAGAPGAGTPGAVTPGAVTPGAVTPGIDPAADPMTSGNSDSGGCTVHSGLSSSGSGLGAALGLLLAAVALVRRRS